jgi:hypothetical protein
VGEKQEGYVVQFLCDPLSHEKLFIVLLVGRYWHFKMRITDTRGLQSITLVESADSGVLSVTSDFSSKKMNTVAE